MPTIDIATLLLAALGLLGSALGGVWLVAKTVYRNRYTRPYRSGLQMGLALGGVGGIVLVAQHTKLKIGGV